MKTALLTAAALTTLALAAPTASADHQAEPTPFTAAVCTGDTWAGNVHVGPKCAEAWTCLGLAEPDEHEVEVPRLHATVYVCLPGPATGPPI